MIIKKYEHEQDWLDARKTKITGSRLKDVITLRGESKKKGYYELIAERMELPGTGENAMDRGHRLEPIAIDEFAKLIDEPIEHIENEIWCREDNPSIAYSPDGKVVGKPKGVEVKCLNGAKHIEAYLTQEIPAEYKFQRLQAFIVCDELEVLYFVFYNPRLIAKQLFYITVTREEVQPLIDKYLAEQRAILAEVEEIVTNLTF